MEKIQFISDLDSGRLLIFLGFGITLLTFSINSKVTMSAGENNGNGKPNNIIQRYADIYRFIKTIYNWGICYFIAAICILFSTQKYENENLKPFLFNIGFLLTLFWTIFLTLVYIKEVIINLIKDLEIGHSHNLDN